MRAYRLPIVSTLLFVILSVGCSGSSSASDSSSGGEDGGPWTEEGSWRAQTPSGEPFSVALPRAPRPMQQPIETPNGEVLLTGYMVEYTDAAFAIFYSPMSAPDSSDETLDRARDGAVSNLGGKLLAEQRLTVAGLPARDLRIATADGSTTVVSRLILAGDRMYQLTTVMPNANAEHPAIGWFLGSFALAGPAGN